MANQPSIAVWFYPLCSNILRGQMIYDYIYWGAFYCILRLVLTVPLCYLINNIASRPSWLICLQALKKGLKTVGTTGIYESKCMALLERTNAPSRRNLKVSEGILISIGKLLNLTVIWSSSEKISYILNGSDIFRFWHRKSWHFQEKEIGSKYVR